MTRLIERLSRLVIAASLSLLIGVVPALPQAALLPNARQQFLDQNGNPVSNGRVYMYVPNTTQPKTTWQDSGQTTPNTNPVQLDAGGYATIYGQGSYQQRVVKSDNVQLWNAPTTAWNSAAPTGATGTDTAPVGAIMQWSGFTLPTNWGWANGQAVNRTTYAALLSTLTISNSSVTCTSGSTVLGGWPDVSQVRVGAPVEATCIPTGTTVVAASGGTITVSNAAVSTATVTARIFPWGNGNGVDTYNVPDLRGRGPFGPDCMGGACASRLLTSANINTTSGSNLVKVSSNPGLFAGMVIQSANVPSGTTINSVGGKVGVVTTVSTTNGSPFITVSSATNIMPGMLITSANIPAATQVSFVNGATITMSAPATATASGTSATFDIAITMSANATATADNTPSTFYSFTSSGVPGATGGAISYALIGSENGRNNFQSTITDPGHQHTETVQATAGGSIMPARDPNGGTNVNSAVSTDFAFTGVSVAVVSDAAGSHHATLPPVLTVGYIIKLKPNTTGAGGVVSLGGMFGDIVCDDTLTCAPVGASPSINTIGCTPASTSQLGCVMPDGVTTIISSGKLVAIAGIASSIGVGGTNITSGTNGRILFDNAGVLGELPVTGTAGDVVLSLSPSITAPTISAPLITGHPTIEGVTSTGATGTGKFVFDTSPLFITPNIGVATATSVNKVVITQPLTGATLTIADGKTVTDTSGVGASLLLGAATGGFDGYAGSTCTNQFIRALTGAGVATCSSVQNTDMINSSVVIGATTVSLGSTLTALVGRSANGLNVESIHKTGDANVIIAATTRTEATSTTLTAARTWTLPAAAAVNPGQVLIISDAAGAINGTNIITVQRSGSDTINGAATFNMDTAYRQVALVSDGVSLWTYDPGAGAGTGVTSFNSRTGSVMPVFTDYVGYVANFLGAY